jgi:hypothetical protein
MARIVMCAVLGGTALPTVVADSAVPEVNVSIADQGTSEQSELFVAGNEAALPGRETVQYTLTRFRSRQSQPGMLFYDFTAVSPGGTTLDGMLGFNLKGDFRWIAGGTVELSGRGVFGFGHLVNGELSGSGAMLAGRSKPAPMLAIEWNGHDLPPKRIWIEATPLILIVAGPELTSK